MNSNDASFLSARSSVLTRLDSNTSAEAAAATSTTVLEAPAYSRDALNRDLMDGFRKRQRAARERQVDHLVFAKGLGERAVASLKDGLYNPRKALPPLKPEEKKMFERMDFKDWRTGRQVDREYDGEAEPQEQGNKNAASQDTTISLTKKGSSSLSIGENAAPADAAGLRSASLVSGSYSTASEELQESCDGAVNTFLKQLQYTTRATVSLRDVRAEVEENIRMVAAALSQQCRPLSFATLLDAVSRALEAMERGDLTENLTVPDCRDAEAGEGDVEKTGDEGEAAAKEASEPAHSTPAEEAVGNSSGASTAAELKTVVLHGAVEVEAYTRQLLLPKAYQAIAIAHSAEWMLQYTMAFLRATEATDAEEADMRLVLLSRCVRMLGDTESFSSVLLSLEAKSEEYAGFTALKDAAETHLGALLDEVEGSLDAVLSLTFPARRSRLLLVERGMQKKLQRALLFLNEIDYSWTPTVHFHWVWKTQFLSSTFRRIHGSIAHKYMQCNMGFIDDAFRDQVADTRITGQYMGASPNQPKVSRAEQVEYERVTEGLTLQQIGMSVKGVASLIVGEQVCMGARYILRQSTKDFDAAWGFHMDEVSTAPTEEDLQKKVAKLAAKAKRQFAGRPVRNRTRPSTTFLTQNE